MKSQRNILMLCYYYPPLIDVGAKRSVAFSKYFLEHGWVPYVLSVKNPDKNYCLLGNDQPPEGVHVEYTYSIINLYWFVSNADAAIKRLLKIFRIELKANIVYNLMCIPDHFWGWVPLTVAKGKKYIKQNNIDVIYVSCTPHSAAISGILLGKLTGRPVVIDYRDPYYIPAYKILGIKKINRRIQSYFLDKADAVIVNNEGTKDIYTKEYPHVKGKIFTVHNGFDTDYLPDEIHDKYNKFTITYTGDFYFDCLLPEDCHSTELIFKAIALLYKQGKINNNNFQFIFYGESFFEINKIAREYEIEELVCANDRIPYKDVIEVLTRSHLQLLRIVKPMISTKLFEGIPLNIPFLATIPHGEVETMINEYSPSSQIITSNSYEEVSVAITRAMSQYSNSEIKNNRVDEFLERYSRENLAIKLMDVIEHEVIAKKSYL